MKKFLTLFTSISLSTSAFAQIDQGQAIPIEELTGLIRWGGVFASTLIIIGLIIFLRFFRGYIDQLSERFVSKRLVLHKFETIIQFFLYAIGTITVIALSIKLDDRILALIGGTLAVAFGFGLKDLAGSLIAGVMIMMDSPFQVGDRLQFGGHYGDVLSIGLRSVKLRTLSDDIVTIPNNKFLSEITSSGNFGEPDMPVSMDFFIANDQDVITARHIISEAAASSRYVFLPKPVVVLVKQTVIHNYVAIKLTLKAYVLDTQYEKLFETDVNLRVIQAFREADIRTASIEHHSQSKTESAESSFID